MRGDVEFIPTPDRVIDQMLRSAAVHREDIVLDLGCGDGRIPIAAAVKCGARGIGVDLDETLVAAAKVRASAAGVSDRTEFRVGNLFEADVSEASVVALYLLDSINVKLRPRLLSECRPGTRIVTYSFEMGEWECDEHTPIAANGVSLWIVPANLAGRWHPPAGGDAFRIEQNFQKLRMTNETTGSSRHLLARGNAVQAMIDGERITVGSYDNGVLRVGPEPMLDLVRFD